MTDSLSRRDVVVLAGLGLAVSACGTGDESTGGGDPLGNADNAGTAATASAPRLPIARMAAACEPWGENPHDDAPSSTTGTIYQYPTFAPDWITILYLELLSDWRIRVNHASFKLATGADADDRLAEAIAALKRVVPTSKRFRDFVNNDNDPYKRSNGNHDGDTFSTFGFESPNELFIFLHHPKIEVDYPLISFGTRGQDGSTRERNFSFFNAEAVPSAGSILDPLGKLIRVRNYVKNERAAPITAENQLYAMNIHFSIDAGTAGRIAMVIDPDTGNGTGNEP